MNARNNHLMTASNDRVPDCVPPFFADECVRPRPTASRKDLDRPSMTASHTQIKGWDAVMGADTVPDGLTTAWRRGGW